MEPTPRALTIFFLIVLGACVIAAFTNLFILNQDDQPMSVGSYFRTIMFNGLQVAIVIGTRDLVAHLNLDDWEIIIVSIVCVGLSIFFHYFDLVIDHA